MPSITKALFCNLRGFHWYRSPNYLIIFLESGLWIMLWAWPRHQVVKTYWFIVSHHFLSLLLDSYSMAFCRTTSVVLDSWFPVGADCMMFTKFTWFFFPLGDQWKSHLSNALFCCSRDAWQILRRDLCSSFEVHHIMWCVYLRDRTMCN
jgi:hypothetical protein